MPVWVARYTNGGGHSHRCQSEEALSRCCCIQDEDFFFWSTFVEMSCSVRENGVEIWRQEDTPS